MLARPYADVRPQRACAPRPLLATLLVAALVLIVPDVASAADRWVDAETGSDAGNDCSLAASPCATLLQGINPPGGQSDDVIHVDDGTYAEHVNVGGQKTLVADDFVASDSGATRIAPVSAGSALFVSASASASGFEISGPASAAVAVVADSGAITDSTIIAAAPNSTALIVFDDAPTVEGNTLIADSGDEDIGIQLNGGVAGAEVTGNRIGEAADGFHIGVKALAGAGASAVIEDNSILGMRQDGGLRGRGIRLIDVFDYEIRENEIAEPGPGTSHGVDVDPLDPGATVRLERNRIEGMTETGVLLIDTAGEVSFDGDLIAGGDTDAMFAGNVEELRMTNVTIAGNGAPLRLNNANLTLDSSIFGEAVDSFASVCEITYSRGTVTTPGGDGCGDFQTAADPGFVSADPTAADYHLTPASPLIDAGNPAVPAAAVDIDGDPRALEGDGACPLDAERDIGYDEVVVAQPDCPVTPPPGPGPAPNPAPEPPPAVDRQAPETTIRGAKRQRGRRAAFTLRASEADSTFECRIDRGRFAPCSERFRSRRLNRGRHTLFARAIDAAGNVDGSPAARKFKLLPKRR